MALWEMSPTSYGPSQSGQPAQVEFNSHLISEKTVAERGGELNSQRSESCPVADLRSEPRFSDSHSNFLDTPPRKKEVTRMQSVFLVPSKGL